MLFMNYSFPNRGPPILKLYKFSCHIDRLGICQINYLVQTLQYNNNFILPDDWKQAITSRAVPHSSLFKFPYDSNPHALRIRSRHRHKEIMLHNYVLQTRLKQLHIKPPEDCRRSKEQFSVCQTRDLVSNFYSDISVVHRELTSSPNTAYYLSQN